MSAEDAGGIVTRLRGPLRPTDVESVLDGVLEWVNDPEVTKNLARFDHVFTREEEREYLTALFASETDRVFALENGAGEYIGQIGIHQIYRPARHGRLGIVLGRKSEWGKGHARRAMGQLLPLAFGDLGLNKLWTIFFTGNARMRHICEALGYQQEGVLRDEYFHQGRFHDMVRMSLLAREWKASARP